MKQYLLIPSPKGFYTDFSQAVDDYNVLDVPKKTLYEVNQMVNTLDLHLTMLKTTFIDKQGYTIRVSRCIVKANVTMDFISEDGTHTLDLVKDDVYECEVVTSTKNASLCVLRVDGYLYPLIPRSTIDIIRVVS